MDPNIPPLPEGVTLDLPPLPPGVVLDAKPNDFAIPSSKPETPELPPLPPGVTLDAIEGAPAPVAAPPLRNQSPEVAGVSTTPGVPSPQPGSQPWAFTRGFVSGMIEQQPELMAESLEGFGYDAPDALRDSLQNSSFYLRGVAALRPDQYALQKKKLQDIGNLSDVTTWLGETLGGGIASMVPSVGLGLAGAGVGGGTGALIAGPPGAVVGGTAGALTGAGSYSYFANHGEVYKALKDEGIPPKLAHSYAKIAAVPMAALDVVSVGPIIARLGGLNEAKREVARTIARRIASEGGKGFTRESITEAAQEAIKLGTVSLAADKPFWTFDNTMGMIEAGIAGGLTGGTVGGVSGFKADRVRARAPTEAEVDKIVQGMGGGAQVDPLTSGDPQVQASQAEPQPWYYSQVAKVALEKLPNSGSGEQMLATIANQPGVKQEELEEIGLPDYLAGKQKVSKEDVVAFVEENAVQVETVEHKEGNVPNIRLVDERPENVKWVADARPLLIPERGQVRAWRAEGAPGWNIVQASFGNGGRGSPPYFWVVNPQGYAQGRGETTLEAAQGNLIRTLRGPETTQYRDWTLPGGDNYREVLLTLPRQGVPKSKQDQVRMSVAELDSKSFVGSHWDEKNVLAHFRATDRRASDGAKMLFVEEVQSDWHQMGREYGYNSDRVAAEKELRELSRELDNLRQTSGAFDAPNATEGLNREGERGRQIRARLGQLSTLVYGDEGKPPQDIPDAPFKTTWSELAVKRILRLAADEGYERVGFATGKMNADRYRQKGDERAGQIEFYDRILPRIVQKWASKLGGKTGRTKFTIDPSIDTRELIGREEPDVFSIEVTPQMASKLERGVPLFSLADNVQISKVGNYDPRMVEAAKTAALAVGQIAKKMKVDAPIRLLLYDKIPGAPTSMGQLLTYGTYNELAGKWVAVDRFELKIGLEQHATPQELYATLSHEFGHILKNYHLDRASLQVKLGMVIEHGKWLKETTGFTLARDRMALRDNFITTSMYSRGFSNDRSMLDMDPETRRYWLSFDEWFAEQTARWMTTDARPLGIVEKFFSSLARKIRESYKFFVLKVTGTEQERALGRPEEFVKNWLDSLLTDTHLAGYEVMKAMERNTKLINQSALDAIGGKEIQAEPLTASTILARKVINKIGGLDVQVQNSLNGSAAVVDKMNKVYWNGVGLVQLADTNTHIPGLQRYRELWQSMQNEMVRDMDRALGTLKKWRKIHGKDRDAVAGLLDDYANLEFLPPQEKAAGVSRRPTTPELMVLVKNNGVTNEGLAIFQEIITSFDDMISRYGDVLLQDAQSISDPIAQAHAIQAAATEIRQLRESPFVPMMHFGNLTLEIKDAAGKRLHFETFESKKKRASAERALQSRKPPGATIHLGVVEEDSRPFLGMPRGILDRIGQKLNLSATQRAALEQLKFELAPAQSFKHRFQIKDRTPGYSTDFMRAYANFFFYGSKHFARVKYVDAMKEQIKEVRNYSAQQHDGTKSGTIANYMDDHFNYHMDPKPDFATLRGIAFLWFLGYSVASATLNLSQMAIGSYPFLASKFGDAKTLGQMANSGARLSTFYKRGTLEEKGKIPSAIEMKALSEGVKRGIITEAMAPELAAMTDGRNLHEGFGKGAVAQGWQRFMEGSSILFEATEQINRRITFRAAWKLAIDNPKAPYIQEAVDKHKLAYDELRADGWTEAHARAFVTAKDATESTQYIYQAYAQPRFMRGKWRTVFVFKTFLQNTLFMLWNYPTAAVRSLLVMAFLGGLMGVPGADDLRGLIKALGWRLFGKDWDVEDEARRLIVDFTDGKVPPDLLLHGMARRGFGLPLLMDQIGMSYPVIDRSRSIGLGRIIPVDMGALFGPQSSRDASRGIAEASQQASGAVFGIGFNLYKALAETSVNGHSFKAWERTMPRFAGSISKGWRVFEEGREKDSRGNTLVRYDTTDSEQMMSAIALAMGYTPLKQSAKWDLRIAELEAVSFWNIRREGLLRQLWEARGSDSYDRVLESVRKFNTDIKGSPAAGKQITADTIRRSFENRARSRNARESGTPRVQADIPIVRDIQRLYPEAEVDVRRTR